MVQAIAGELADIGHAAFHDYLTDSRGSHAGLTFPPRLGSIIPCNVADIIRHSAGTADGQGIRVIRIGGKFPVNIVLIVRGTTVTS